MGCHASRHTAVTAEAQKLILDKEVEKEELDTITSIASKRANRNQTPWNKGKKHVNGKPSKYHKKQQQPRRTNPLSVPPIIKSTTNSSVEVSTETPLERGKRLLETSFVNGSFKKCKLVCAEEEREERDQVCSDLAKKYPDLGRTESTWSRSRHSTSRLSSALDDSNDSILN